MYTYQLQPRSLVSDGLLEFPGLATIVMELTEVSALGFGVPGTSFKAGTAGRMCVDLDTGRASAVEARLEPFEVAGTWESGQATLAGNRLVIEAEVESAEALVAVIMLYFHQLPPLLAVELSDPVAVIRVQGDVGGKQFCWRHSAMAVPCDWTTEQQQMERVARAQQRVVWLGADSNRRLAAALAYHHTAQRLLAVGVSTWEFMSSAILNLNKALEVLFCDTRICGNSNQQTMTELERLGVPESERKMLISLMKLRNHADVGHVDTWLFDPDDLTVLYRFLERVLAVFPSMLARLVSCVEEGTYKLKPAWPLAPDDDVKALFEFMRDEYSDLLVIPGQAGS